MLFALIFFRLLSQDPRVLFHTDRQGDNKWIRLFKPKENWRKIRERESTVLKMFCYFVVTNSSIFFDSSDLSFMLMFAFRGRLFRLSIYFQVGRKYKQDLPLWRQMFWKWRFEKKEMTNKQHSTHRLKRRNTLTVNSKSVTRYPRTCLVVLSIAK